MLRFINICLVIGLVALACVIYQVKYEARSLDRQIAAVGKQIEAERDAVAVLRAEWSLLNRPERIERLAKKHLHLEASAPRQLVTLDTVTDRDFDRFRKDETSPAATPRSKSTNHPSVATKPVEVLPWATATLPWHTATIPSPIPISAQ
ncbi:MAG: cell division protein FtsL [Methyloceanibacter sp.]